MTKDVLQFQNEQGEAQLRLVPERSDLAGHSVIDRQFVNFNFLRISPEWRKIDADSKRIYKAEFASVFDSFAKDLLLFTYSLVGFDARADLMFWRVGTSLDMVQEMTAQLFGTKLGSYLETVDNYLSFTKRMMFVIDQAEDRQRVKAGTGKYHFFYPCAKPDNLQAMSIDERDTMIEENFMVGKKFPNIKIHLTHAFGFTESEYLLSFETNEPRDFLALSDELRQTTGGKINSFGMPVYTCRQRSLMDCLDALG